MGIQERLLSTLGFGEDLLEVLVAPLRWFPVWIAEGFVDLVHVEGVEEGGVGFLIGGGSDGRHDDCSLLVVRSCRGEETDLYTGITCIDTLMSKGAISLQVKVARRMPSRLRGLPPLCNRRRPLLRFLLDRYVSGLDLRIYLLLSAYICSLPLWNLGTRATNAPATP